MHHPDFPPSVGASWREQIQGIWLCLVAGVAGPASAANLTVHIQNILSTDGQLRVALFAQETQWPILDDYDKPPQQVRARLIRPEPAGGEQVLVFKDLQPGRYAISVHHDINADSRFNRQIWPFTGMPSEPYGFSNNHWQMFTSASFADSSLVVIDKDQDCVIWISTHMSKITSGGAPPAQSAPTSGHASAPAAQPDAPAPQVPASASSGSFSQ